MMHEIIAERRRELLDRPVPSRQSEALAILRDYYGQNGVPPSCRYIGAQLGIGRSPVSRYLQALHHRRHLWRVKRFYIPEGVGEVIR